jgi:hypothetical protein|tara:strand:+ start:463 stop:720 length:258 start_codon:yes stop_codon:yes gene_type:complete
MLTERTVVDLRKVLANGIIEARTVRIIEDEDGTEISRMPINRQLFAPGDDVSEADASIKRLAEVEHTPEVVAAYEARLAELAAGE